MLATYIYTLILVYTGFSVLYLLVFAFISCLARRRREKKMADPLNRIAVLVPAYKEDTIIVATAENLLGVNYPRDLYDLYIIADSFKPETVTALRQLPLTVLEVAFEKSTKAKALNNA